MDYQRQNGSKKYLTKKASQPRGNLVVFSKNYKQNNTMISGEKTCKILKVQKFR